MRLIQRLQTVTQAADKFAYQICGACMLVIMVVGAADVVLGNTIGVRPPGTVDISQSLFVTSVFLALPFVVRHQDHIRVDLFINLFPRGFQKFATAFAALLGGAVYCAMAYAMWDLFTASWAVNEHSISVFAFPIYPIKFLAFVGLTLAALISLGQVLTPRSVEHDEILGDM